MELFAVFRQGMYRHECGGVFDSQTRAIVAACKLIRAESDDYHKYTVVPFTLNHCEPKFTGNGYWAKLAEAKPIFEVRRRGSELIERGGHCDAASGL